MENNLSLIIGFLIGSIPTAYLLMKKTKGIDIRNEGSGNVGAMNTLDVTNSKLYAGIVLLADLAKGSISALIPMLIFGGDFMNPLIGVFGAVFGHCFSPWIGFKGGRGLATAAGGALTIFPFLLIIWLLIWTIAYLIKKDIILANVWACLMTIITVSNSEYYILKYSFLKIDSPKYLILFTLLIMTVILIKHIEPLKELIINQKEKFNKRGKR